MPWLPPQQVGQANSPARGTGGNRAPRRKFRRFSPLTNPKAAPILAVSSTTKGGDPVSHSKRCHLAGIARWA